jgi:phosphoenolpyruvate carboxykinase (GTP)
VDPAELKQELPAIHQHFARFGDRLPKQLRAQLKALEERLAAG